MSFVKVRPRFLSLGVHVARQIPATQDVSLSFNRSFRWRKIARLGGSVSTHRMEFKSLPFGLYSRNLRLTWTEGPKFNNNPLSMPVAVR